MGFINLLLDRGRNVDCVRVRSSRGDGRNWHIDNNVALLLLHLFNTNNVISLSDGDGAVLILRVIPLLGFEHDENILILAVFHIDAALLLSHGRGHKEDFQPFICFKVIAVFEDIVDDKITKIVMTNRHSVFLHDLRKLGLGLIRDEAHETVRRPLL